MAQDKLRQLELRIVTALVSFRQPQFHKTCCPVQASSRMRAKRVWTNYTIRLEDEKI